MSRKGYKFSAALRHVDNVKKDLNTLVDNDTAFDYTDPDEQSTPESRRAAAKQFYSENLDKVKQGLLSYSESVSSKTSDMFDLITGYLTLFASTDERHPVTTFWEYFNAAGALDETLALTADSLYLGIEVLEMQDYPKLTELGNKAANAESTDSSYRSSIQNILMTKSMKNTLRNIFEVPEYKVIVKNCPELPEIGKIIYEDWEAAAVIVEFKLDIYIPSYVSMLKSSPKKMV